MKTRMMPVLSLFVAASLVVGPATRVLGAPGSMGACTLGPGDSIDIMVEGDKDLSQTVTIKPDGTIDLSLIGEVTAAGSTTSQVAVELTKRYSKYLIAPSCWPMRPRPCMACRCSRCALCRITWRASARR